MENNYFFPKEDRIWIKSIQLQCILGIQLVKNEPNTGLEGQKKKRFIIRLLVCPSRAVTGRGGES